tara:strand:+ start:2190 stop:3482 length:1293 start_codon:yes stop_codon:yes gene_type:complete
MPSATSWGFFLDDSSQWTNTPGTSVIIANERASFQKTVNNKGRVFGFDAAFKDGATSARANWNRLSNNASTIKSSTNNQDKANNILNTVFLYGVGVLSNRGTAPIPGEGWGDWFYAQNFQVEDGNVDANQVYAQVTAITWAFKQLYPEIPSIPTFDSYFVKSNEGTFSIEEINKNLAELGLKINAIPAKSSDKSEQWNFISTLYENKLIDGFIGDSFTVGQQGSIPPGSLPFYQSNIPYALESKYPNITQGDKFVSHYYGWKDKTPLQASIYFASGVNIPNNFSPDSYFSTKEVPLGSNNTVGTESHDSITGTNKADNIHGLSGDDVILGGKGDDQLNGNNGKDFLYGGRGNDSSWGGADADTFHLSSGQDKIHDFSIADGDKIACPEPVSLWMKQDGKNLILWDGNDVNTTLLNVSMTSFNQSDSLLKY